MPDYELGQKASLKTKVIVINWCILDIRKRVKKKRAFLLSVVGGRTYGLIKTLLAPAKPVDKTFKERTDLVKNHLSPKPIQIAERFKFYRRKQEPGEPVAKYLQELRKLAETCNFSQFLGEVLRDVFVIGLQDASAQKKLLGEKELDLAKAFDTAQSHEMTSKQVEDMHGSASVNKMYNKTGKTGQRECYRCGKRNHDPDNCFFKNVRCFGCSKRGHIEAMCPDQEHKPEQKERRNKTASEKSSNEWNGRELLRRWIIVTGRRP